MSLRTVLRLSLIMILTLIVAGPGSAQAPNPWRIHTAPMPRVVPRIIIQSEEEIFEVEGQPRINPMPRGKPRVIVCAEGFFQVEVPSGIHACCDFTPACPSVIHFRPVPMPRAIVDVIGNIEFGYPEGVWSGSSTPVTMFRPAPIVRASRPSSITAIEPTFTWNYSSPLPPPMPRAIVEVIGQGNAACRHASPIQTVCAGQANADHSAAHVGGPGGWWLDEVRVPQPKSRAAIGSIPLVVVEASAWNNWWKPCDRGAGVAAKEVVPVLKPPPAPSAQLSGTWYREIEGTVFSAAFCGDELKICMTQREEGSSICFTLTADYAITTEGLVHGVVTGVDIDAKLDPIAPAGARCSMPPASMAAELQKFVDCPFSFRTKSTSAGVMVSNLRFAAAGMDMEQLALVCGMFKPAPNGNVPSPKATRTAVASPACCEALTYPPVVASPYQPVPATSGSTAPASMPVVPAGYTVPGSPMPAVPMMVPPAPPVETSSIPSSPQIARVLGTKTLPSGHYLQHYPEYFPPDPQHPLPRELVAREDPVGATKLAAQRTGISIKPLPTSAVAGGVLVVMPSPTYSPPRPTNIPPGDFGMMSEVFGQMLGGKTQTLEEPATVLPPVVTTTPVPPMPIPTPPRIEKPR